MRYNNLYLKRFKITLMMPAKVANTSIKTCVAEQYGWSDKTYKYWMRSRYVSPKEVTKLGTTNILFVRNPYDRFVSLYENKCNNDKKYWPRCHKKSFSEFVDFITTTEHKLTGDIHSRLQIADVMCRGRFLPDMVVRYEQLAKGWEVMCNEYNLPFSELPHKNKSKKRKPWQEYYNSVDRDKIYNYYKRDFELLGYDRWDGLTRKPISLKKRLQH